MPVEAVNTPELMARHESMVTINGAIAVDIQGQVVADTVAGNQYSGVGGHEDFVSGPSLSLRGASLLCLPSTAKVGDEVVSRIVPWFPAGTVITTPRHQVDVIVTEYGAADLMGKTVHQRGIALAEIAHPDFRDELLEAAERTSGGRSPIPGGGEGRVHGVRNRAVGALRGSWQSKSPTSSWFPRRPRQAPSRQSTRPPRSSAAADLLEALGLDLTDESLRETPRRMVAAYVEQLTPQQFQPTTFPNDGGYDELVVARSIPFHSLCEHHMLPFVGVAHVGYLPGARIIGLSKLARVVELFARSPQVQERLTTQIAGWLQDHLEPKGVGVVLEAEHLCMTLRGVQKQGSSTITSALHGLLRDDPRTRQEFLALTDRPNRV